MEVNNPGACLGPKGEYINGWLRLDGTVAQEAPCPSRGRRHRLAPAGGAVQEQELIPQTSWFSWRKVEIQIISCVKSLDFLNGKLI
jgi:hypothetical protein